MNIENQALILAETPDLAGEEFLINFREMSHVKEKTEMVTPLPSLGLSAGSSASSGFADSKIGGQSLSFGSTTKEKIIMLAIVGVVVVVAAKTLRH